VLLEGRDLLSMPDRDLIKLRLKEVALMPQAAMNSLNPVVRVGPQFKDAIQAHMGRLPDRQMNEMIAQALAKVGLKPEVARRFPHQLSGGMKQRVVMAIATILHPKVIIADEPTSALDVVVQQQVMATLGRLQQELGAAVVLIGHDMGLITQFSDSVGVLYAGKLVERGDVQAVLATPLHPYSRMLIDSLPTLDGKRALVGIPGLPPELLHLPSGCAFHTRCPFAMERCKVETPALQTPLPGRQVSCHLYPEHKQLPPLAIKIDSATAAAIEVAGKETA
jgi:peptide/nickel transport system ATP-binding protein